MVLFLGSLLDIFFHFVANLSLPQLDSPPRTRHRAITGHPTSRCYFKPQSQDFDINPHLSPMSKHLGTFHDHSVCCLCHPGLLLVEDLDISFSVVTDFGLLQLAASSTCLKKLTLADLDVVNVWTCALYTEYGLAEMKRLRPDVKQCLVFV